MTSLRTNVEVGSLNQGFGFFFLNNAGELRVISLRRKKQRAGRNRPKYNNTMHTQKLNSENTAYNHATAKKGRHPH
jgi:hypothetical protein